MFAMVESDAFDEKILADFKAGVDRDELAVRVQQRLSCGLDQARDYLSLLTFGPDTPDSEDD